MSLVLCRRRAPGSRFVPPVRREDNNTVMCSDTLRTNRIPYDNSNTSSSELEGDPRLKNIEPRMVELIMNEVYIYTYTHCLR